ncbi:MAG: dihydroxy-acid dehydratase [Cytophagaceae bacterium]|nr:dihydroxy-acid dehydratase [Cytophagaceae bacterium]MDW8456188.1 dihydroxy-acid dehydratase [Cytophagaceae bacterium]
MTLNKYSSRLTQDPSQPASQAMLYGAGFTDEDMQKAQVAIASTGYEGNTCNMHLNELAAIIKESIKNAGLKPLQFNTIGVSDGMSMGTDGMRYSLISRDVIADSIEAIAGAHYYDSLVTVVGCDKNMPGAIMAMARLNRPSIMVYGGTIRSGVWKGEKLNIVSAFEALGKKITNAISEEDFKGIIKNSVPGAGACGGMYTANTMASAIEAMGMSLPYSSSAPATSDKKKHECASVGAAIKLLLEKDIKPKDIITYESISNGVRLAMILGGSTNLILHFLAIAKTAGIKFTLKDFQALSDKTPMLADLKPSGKYMMEDLDNIGGVPSIMKMMLDEGLLYPDCMTVTGKTIKENLANFPYLPQDQDIIRPLTNPIKKTGHLQILWGNLAPDGAVAKITGKEGEVFEGEAICYDSEEELNKGIEKGEVKAGHVVVIRYVGPKGAPGMPEMLKPTSLIIGAGLGDKVALITDGRFSGGTHGFVVGHITPEAQEGGNIALVKNGDRIRIDAVRNTIDVLVSDEELSSRRKVWTKPEYKAKSGLLYKYIRTVAPASEGCVTDAY